MPHGGVRRLGRAGRRAARVEGQVLHRWLRVPMGLMLLATHGQRLDGPLERPYLPVPRPAQGGPRAGCFSF